MSEQQWLKAALAYEKAITEPASVPVPFRNHPLSPPRPDLESFISSAEGRAACRLLKASNFYLILAKGDDGRTLVTESIVLSGDGFQKLRSAGGMASIFLGRDSIVAALSSVEAGDLIRLYWKIGYVCSPDVLSYIRGELDAIAEKAPSRALSIQAGVSLHARTGLRH